MEVFRVDPDEEKDEKAFGDETFLNITVSKPGPRTARALTRLHAAGALVTFQFRFTPSDVFDFEGRIETITPVSRLIRVRIAATM